jgi:hypothetical protein
MKIRKIADRVVSAMSRGVLVVDENQLDLAGPLGERNIRVVTPSSGMSDDDIKRSILPKRILVTRNTKDFIDDASSFEYGIISLEKLKHVDGSTAAVISRAIVDYKLWSKKHGFLLVLKDDGKHEYTELTQ